MRTLLLLAVSLAVVSCKKDEPERYSIAFDASCRTCIVVYGDGVHAYYDTIIGTIAGNDTLIGNMARHNIVLEEGYGCGATIYGFDVADTTLMTVTISGDVPTETATARWPNSARVQYP